MRANIPSALLALLLAVFCWFLVTGRERVDTWMRLRLEIVGEPEDLLVSGLPPFAEVRLRGPRGAIQNAEKGSLSYSLDLRGLKPGKNEITLVPERVTLPRTLEAMELRPARLDLSAEKKARRSVPVELTLAKTAGLDYQIAEKRLEPDNVAVSGGENALARVSRLPTQPLVLPADPPARLETVLELDVPAGVSAAPAQVKAVLRFAPVPRETRLEVPVHVSGPVRGKVSLSPETVKLVLEVPSALLRDKGFKDQVEASLVLAPNLAPGRYQATYKVKMPPGCKLVEAKPEKVTVLIK